MAKLVIMAGSFFVVGFSMRSEAGSKTRVSAVLCINFLLVTS